jgi:hypothetical protein
MVIRPMAMDVQTVKAVQHDHRVLAVPRAKAAIVRRALDDHRARAVTARPAPIARKAKVVPAVPAHPAAAATAVAIAKLRRAKN